MKKFMIRLGPAGLGGAKEAAKNLQNFAELGLNACEVAFTYSIYLKNQDAIKIGEVAKKLNVQLSIHCPYWINLASKEKIKIEQSKKRILDSCERAHLMGASPVVFHPAYFGGQDKEKIYQITKEAILDMMETVKKKGWNVELAPETTGKHSALGSLDETIRLVRETGCSMCLDPAHLFARNYGQIDFGLVLHKLKPLKLKHIHSHFSNINFTSKGERNHEVLDHKPDFRLFAKAILKRKLNITIISETPDTWKGSLKMKKILESMGHKF